MQHPGLTGRHDDDFGEMLYETYKCAEHAGVETTQRAGRVYI
jgi:hypothetical protein